MDEEGTSRDMKEEAGTFRRRDRERTQEETLRPRGRPEARPGGWMEAGRGKLWQSQRRARGCSHQETAEET